MTTPTILTARLMERLTERPCYLQWRIVEQEWPQAIPLTDATIVRARELGLDLGWLGVRLPGQAGAEYERVRYTAGVEYRRVHAAAWVEYKRVRDAALAEYERGCGAAWAEYERARDAALTECERVCGAAWAEYERVRDAALLAALRRLAEEEP